MPEMYVAREAVVPIRGNAAESAEMVSQVLFGEALEKLEEEGNWYKVKMLSDGYEGWVNPRMLLPIDQKEYEAYENWQYVLEGSLMLDDGSHMRLPLGVKIPVSSGQSAFDMAGHRWSMSESIRAIDIQEFDKRVDIARYFFNIPYLWGGRSGFGIDCSGFSQMVYAICGVSIPRDSSQQAKEGKTIPFGEHQPGDLAFFAKPQQSRVTHVGILIHLDHILHASGRVRKDRFEESGIIDIDSNQLTHKLIIIKRW